MVFRYFEVPDVKPYSGNVVKLAVNYTAISHTEEAVLVQKYLSHLDLV